MCSSDLFRQEYEPYVPVFNETMMRVELEEELFVLPELHDLRAGPARPATLAPIHVQYAEARIVQEWERILFWAMLPADPEAELLRPPGFGQAVEDCGNELWVAIRGDGNEDGHRRARDWCAVQAI